jgi:hypothetical protein
VTTGNTDGHEGRQGDSESEGPLLRLVVGVGRLGRVPQLPVPLAVSRLSTTSSRTLALPVSLRLPLAVTVPVPVARARPGGRASDNTIIRRIRVRVMMIRI